MPEQSMTQLTVQETNEAGVAVREGLHQAARWIRLSRLHIIDRPARAVWLDPRDVSPRFGFSGAHRSGGGLVTPHQG